MTDSNLIRRRYSYTFWIGVIKFLESKPNIPDTTKKIDEYFDDKSAYGFRWLSDKSKESLKQALKDKGY